MGRIIIAGFLGALVLFVWGFLSWAVLPWNEQSMHTLPNEDAVMAVLKSQNLENGLYRIPGHKDNSEVSKKAAYEKMKTGPMAMIHYSNEGMDMPGYMIKGFIILFLAAVAAASLLGKLSWSLASKYGARVRYVMMLGIFIAIAARLSDWAWYGASTSFVLTVAINDIIGWTLAGLVIAWRMKPMMTKTS